MAISALITGSGGGFLFEQTAGSQYRLENLEWERAVPGGDKSATIYTRFNGAFQLPSLGSLVVLSDLVGPFWLGLFDTADVEYWDGGANVVLHCVGFSSSADDRIYTARQVFVIGDTAGDMFRHARNTLCPDISQTNDFIQGTADVALEEESQNFRGDSALTVWNAAAALGSTNADADQLIWLVRPPMVAGYDQTVPILEIYALADAPSYTIDLTQGYAIRTRVERSQLRNHIFVNYGTGSGDPLHEVAAVNPIAEAFSVQGFAEYNNHERQMWVDSNNIFRGAQFAAQRVADANLAKYGVVHGSGFTVSIPFDGTGDHPIVVDPGPDVVPIWRVQAGWLLNIDNDQSWAGLPNNPARLITSVHGSLRDGQIQVTTGVLGDSRQAQRLTGVATLRALLDLPPLSRPNRPEEWQRSTIDLIKEANDDLGFLHVTWPHIVRYITVFVYNLDDLSTTFNSVDVVVGLCPQEGFPTADVLGSATVTATNTQIVSGLDRRVDPGAIYTFTFSNPDPARLMVLASVAVDRIKVVE